MPEIEFRINALTGELTTHIEGRVGTKVGEEIVDLIKEFAGVPSIETVDANYTRFQPVRTQQRVRGS